MHPRESPKRVQSRRKTQPGLAPGKALQQRVGLFWGLTRRAGVSKDAGGCCAACPCLDMGCATRLARHPRAPRRGSNQLPLTLIVEIARASRTTGNNLMSGVPVS